MAELTNLEEKLAEVTGLAMAAEAAGGKVTKFTEEQDESLVATLQKMAKEAAETVERCEQVAGTFEGKKTAILDEAREVKKKAAEMMSTYLDKDADALDGFEFLTMAEAAEVGHWSVLADPERVGRQRRRARARLVGAADPAAALRGRAPGLAEARGRGGSERDELDERGEPLDADVDQLLVDHAEREAEVRRAAAVRIEERAGNDGDAFVGRAARDLGRVARHA